MIGASRERGVALLTAILLVALGTIVAAAVSYRNVLTARRVAATYAFEQSLFLAQGAEALAAYALREDARSGGSNDRDDRTEPWARPYGPVEVAPDVLPGVVLEVVVSDLNGRFNLNTLVRNGEVDPGAVQTFERLLELLGLETRWAPLIADWLDANTTAHSPEGGEDNLYLSQDPAYRPPNIAITSVSELLALPEFGRERYLRLAPHVTALPPDAPLNVCVASALVLDAYNEGQQEHSGDLEGFAKKQAEGCFPTKEAYEASFDSADALARARNSPGIAETTTYFRLTSVVSIGTAQFALYSLLRREGDRVRVVMRSYSPD